MDATETQRRVEGTCLALFVLDHPEYLTFTLDLDDRVEIQSFNGFIVERQELVGVQARNVFQDPFRVLNSY